MTTFEFFALLNDYPFSFIGSLLISLLFFGLVMKKSTSSWLNPIRVNIFTFSIGISVVLFLNFFGYVSNKTFVYTISSTVLFWGVFLLIFRNKQKEVIIKFGDEPILAKWLFYCCYFIFVLMTLISYKLLGIPLFNENGRLTTYTGSGLGFIARIIPVLQTYCIFYIIHLFISNKSAYNKVKPFFLLLPILIFGILSGSRSSFLATVFTFWGYKTFYLNDEPKALDYKKLLIPTLLISMISFLINSSGNLVYALYMFFERAVASGDLYWEALPDDTWSSVVIDSPFQYTFMGFLGPLHILDPAKAEIPIGFQLQDIVYPVIAGSSTGPVALFPIFGLVCFGYIGGLIFSFIQGLFTSLLFKFSFIKSNSVIISAFAYFTFYNVTILIGDISAGLGTLLNVIVSYVFIIFLLLFIAFVLYSKDIWWKLKLVKTIEK